MDSADLDRYGKAIWDYMLLHAQPKKCDAVLTLGSIDTRVADYGVDLFLAGMGEYLIFSGGVAHIEDLLKTSWEDSEAEHFAQIALQRGVPENKILIENKARNTGQNITFTYELLNQKKLYPTSLLLVQKPYMERRTYATFKKQWPGQEIDILVTSPPIPYEEYFNDENPKDKILNVMVGDLQRIKEYPTLGYQIKQDIPDDVWQAYEELVKLGFTKHLVK
jgi:uncharacterized SAM-binding protein YcdF (DUF218 family)